MIQDREGFAFANYSMAGKRFGEKLMGVLNDIYIHRVASVFMVNMNWFSWTIFNVFKVFMGSEMKAKLSVLTSTDKLKDYFTPENLLKEMGGTGVMPAK